MRATTPPIAKTPDESSEPGEDGVVLDAKNSPIIEVIFPSQVTKAALDRHFDELLQLAAGNRRFALLVNLDNLLSVPKDIRAHASDKLRETNQRIGKSVVCVAHLTDNWLSRAILTVVLSGSKNPYPEKTFRKRDHAERWIRTQLAK